MKPCIAGAGAHAFNIEQHQHQIRRQLLTRSRCSLEVAAYLKGCLATPISTLSKLYVWGHFPHTLPELA